MKTYLSVSAFVIASGIYSAAFAAPPTAQDKADTNAVNSACAQDAATAGCSDAVVGKGLLKCLHGHKRTNQSFQFSAGCKAAIKQLHSDKKAGK